MTDGGYTDQTVDKAVALANLSADGAVTPQHLRDVLATYVLTDIDVEAFVDLAEWVHAIIGAGDPVAQLRRLNDLLGRVPATPRIVEHDGQPPHMHYVTADGPAVLHVGASFAMALATTLIDHGAQRFGQCAAPACRQVYVDRSRAGRQRFCSKTCATRVHVAAHRARS